MNPALNQIYQGDAKDVLAAWPQHLAHLCLTSPPYFQQRDYGVVGQLGLEETPEAYIARLVMILDQVHRVLRADGSLYLNLGDSYHARSLMGIPWRVALALTERGWLLRNCIVWSKKNPLPTSTTTRYCNAHEFLFFFVKARDYFFDLDAVREPHCGGPRTFQARRRRIGRLGTVRGGNFAGHPLGKTPRDVWELHTENRPKKYIVPGYRGHFAPFPESLCERPIRASSPRGGVVVDPFIGSGTTALVARRLGRRYLGIDLSAEYVELARKRLEASRECSQSLLHPRYLRVTPTPDRNPLDPERSTLPEAA